MKKLAMNFSSTVDEGDHLLVKDGIRAIIQFGMRKGILSLGVNDNFAFDKKNPDFIPVTGIPLERSGELTQDAYG